MQALRPSLPLPVALLTTLILVAPLTACQRGGLMGGSSSPTGNSDSQGAQQQKNTGGKGAQPQFTEPQDSVSGTPSAASDRGSPDAVSHRSVAQPGAPQGTLPAQPQVPKPAAPPAHP